MINNVVVSTGFDCREVLEFEDAKKFSLMKHHNQNEVYESLKNEIETKSLF